MTNAGIDESTFQKFWGSLLRTANGVPFPDREDLASEAIKKGLENLDESKGNLRALSHAILKNLVKNYWRDKKKTVPFEEDSFGVEPEKLLIELEREMTLREIKGFQASLTNEEQAFTEMLGAVLLEMDGRAISETARRLGLTALQGHDILRRIRTKAEKNSHLRDLSTTQFSELQEMAYDVPQLLRDDSGDVVSRMSAMMTPNEDVGLQMKVMASLLALQKGMNRFLGPLSDNEKIRISSLLQVK